MASETVTVYSGPTNLAADTVSPGYGFLTTYDIGFRALVVQIAFTSPTGTVSGPDYPEGPQTYIQMALPYVYSLDNENWFSGPLVGNIPTGINPFISTAELPAAGEPFTEWLGATSAFYARYLIFYYQATGFPLNGTDTQGNVTTGSSSAYDAEVVLTYLKDTGLLATN